MEVGAYGDGRPFARLSLGTSETPAPHSKGVSILFEPNDPALLTDGNIPASLKLSDLSKAMIGVNNVMYGKVYKGTFSGTARKCMALAAGSGRALASP